MTHVEHRDRIKALDKALKVEYPEPCHHVMNK